MLLSIISTDTVYNIEVQVLPGWPFSYGLLIAHNGMLDFLGIADNHVNIRYVHIDSKMPPTFPPLNIELSSTGLRFAL